MIFQLEQVSSNEKPLIGSKAYAVAELAHHGVTVPRSICVAIDAYEDFVQTTGLQSRIMMEFHRKTFEQMRWEEMWDASLRIQHMFQGTTWPSPLRQELAQTIKQHFPDQSVVVRSSAPGEDSEATSFAGLHESYVNIYGVDEILKHIKLVWASLWSDAAMMYRRELGLEVETSRMAVLVQEIVPGEVSGILFTQSPTEPSQAVIESVYGLNQALVDGSIEPDRWILNRENGAVISSHPADKTKLMVPDDQGVKLRSLPSVKLDSFCLNANQIDQLFQHGQTLETVFQTPQDIEWTYRQEHLYTLQSRPITVRPEEDDPRGWYLTLRRSFENLQVLRTDIQDRLIPQMIEGARVMSEADLSSLTEQQLRQEIERRKQIYKKWQDIYWEKFIPFAHGVRLFGQFYNRAVQPEDPYEFVDLLADTPMQSTQRNTMLDELAQSLRAQPELAHNLRHHPDQLTEEFKLRLDKFLDAHGNQAWGLSDAAENQGNLVQLLLEMAAAEPRAKKATEKTVASLQRQYFDSFPPEQQEYAAEVLDLARVSYQLRDDDNIYLARIEDAVVSVMTELRRRTQNDNLIQRECINYEEMLAAFKELKQPPRKGFAFSPTGSAGVLKARQLVGQPAAGGLATGRARVINEPQDVFQVKAGEVVVCDSIDPNMTFVVPLVAAIVERRGGMLVHGAIIAREYGVPCVTGVPEATSVIRSGSSVTVDGYVGIVTIDSVENGPKE